MGLMLRATVLRSGPQGSLRLWGTSLYVAGTLPTTQQHLQIRTVWEDTLARYRGYGK